jgi:hypothetical protein
MGRRAVLAGGRAAGGFWPGFWTNRWDSLAEEKTKKRKTCGEAGFWQSARC